MSTTISDDQFRHVALLSSLPLTPEDDYIRDQLAQAAEYVSVLDELSSTIAPLPPTYQVNQKQNVLRPDVVTPSFTQAEALAAANSSKNGYFVTTPTIKKI